MATKLLANKVMIVTGSSSGIGRATAIAAARHGADVVLHHLGPVTESDVQRVATEIGKLGQKSVIVAGDIGKPETASAIVSAAVGAFKRIDVLVSNAGICPFHTFLDMPDSLWKKVQETNLDGCFYVTRAVANQMASQTPQGGSIVAVSSISAMMGGGGQTHYTPTKAGVKSLMESCAIALGPSNIRCNSILPGTIETPINAEDLSDPVKRADQVRRVPTGRLGEPEDIAEPICFMASDMARYVNGASLLVDGGMKISLPASKKRKISSSRHRAASASSSPSGSRMSDGEDLVARPVSVTCLSCRGRKIKCDSEKPICGNCFRSTNVCVYLKKQKPGLKAGSGDTMMRRIEMLEEGSARQADRLRELEDWRSAFLSTSLDLLNDASMPFASPGAQGENGSGANHHDIPLSSTTNSSNQPDDPESAAAGPAISPALSVQQEESMERIARYPSGHMSYQRRSPYHPPTMEERHRAPGLDPAGFGEASFCESGAFYNYAPPQSAEIWTIGMTLPRDDVVLDLIEIFMRKIAPTAFFIHPHSRWDRPWNVVVHAIVASAARISDDQHLTAHRAHICEAARNYVFLQTMSTTSIETMQALALISLDVLSSGKGPEQWSPLAMLSRLALNLDLSREDEGRRHNAVSADTARSQRMSSPRGVIKTVSKAHVIEPSLEWREDEARRRLFWFVYMLDRYTSASAGWDSAITADIIQRALPCADLYWCGVHWMSTEQFVSPPEPHGDRKTLEMKALSPAAFLVEALDFMARSHTLQTRSIDLNDASDIESRRGVAIELSNIVSRWFKDRRRHIDSGLDSGSVHPLALLTHGIYHVTMCKLQCFYAYPAVNPTGVKEPYAGQCLASAQAICEISQRATDFNAHPGSISPMLIWICWVGARVLFAHSCWEARPVIRPEFCIIVASLSEMAIRYELAAEYVKLLLRAERRWQAMNTDLANSPKTGGSTSMAVSVLLDLRRNAYGATRAAKGDETPIIPLAPAHAQGDPMDLLDQHAHALATDAALQATGLASMTDDANFQSLVAEVNADYRSIPLAGRSGPSSGVNTPWSGHANGAFSNQQHRLAFGSLDNYFDHLDIFGSSFGNGFGQ